MSDAVLKLAAASRLLLSRLDPIAGSDDEQMFSRFIGHAEADLIAVLQRIEGGSSLEQCANCCIEELYGQGYKEIDIAFEQAHGLVETGNVQHSDPASLLVYSVAGITSVGVFVLIPLMLATRMKQISVTKRGIQLSFFEGVPKETIALFEKAIKGTPAIDNLIKQIDAESTE